MPRARRAPPPHVDLWDDYALIVSTLGDVDRHAHAVPAVVMGLEGPFHYGEGEGWTETPLALIPAGRRHRLSTGNQRMLTVYLTGPAAPERLGPEPTDRRWAQLGSAALQTARGELSRADMQRVLTATLTSEGEQAVPNPRLDQLLTLLRSDGGGGLGVETCAEALGLSASRLMHLLRETLGVSFRQLRGWERMRRATQVRAEGENLTHACLAAGFADSSHFSHAFRRTFGVTASSILGREAQVRADFLGAM